MAVKTLINGLSGGLNFNMSLMSDMALIAIPEPKATFFLHCMQPWFFIHPVTDMQQGQCI